MVEASEHLAPSQSRTGTGGKPSTWFPPERLAEPSDRNKGICGSKAQDSYRCCPGEKRATAMPRRASRRFVSSQIEAAPRLGESAVVEASEQLAPSQSRITLEPKEKALRVISFRDEGFIEIGPLPWSSGNDS